MHVKQYKIPQTPQVFSLLLPYALNPGDWFALGIVMVNGAAELLVQEDEKEKNRQEWKFALVASEQIIPADELRYGCSHLGSFEKDGTVLHLFGPKTRREGGKRF